MTRLDVCQKPSDLLSRLLLVMMSFNAFTKRTTHHEPMVHNRRPYKSCRRRVGLVNADFTRVLGLWSFIAMEGAYERPGRDIQDHARF